MTISKNKASFPAHVENGRVTMHPQNALRRQSFLDTLGTCDATETIEKEKKRKSPNQLGYIFGVIIDLTKKALDERGEDVNEAPYTKGQIKQIYYYQHHVKHGGVWENFDKYQTLSEHDDMAITSDFIDSCLHYAAHSKWRIFLPDPRPQGPGAENVEL